jgi:hypothetical protein
MYTLCHFPPPRVCTHTLTLSPPHTTHTDFGLIMDAMRTQELPSSDALQFAVKLIGCCAQYYSLEVRTSSGSAARCLGVSTGGRNGEATRVSALH